MHSVAIPREVWMLARHCAEGREQTVAQWISNAVCSRARKEAATQVRIREISDAPDETSLWDRPPFWATS